MSDPQQEGRRAALAELRGLGRRVAQDRLLGSVRRAQPPAPAPTAAPAEGPTLLERIQALKSAGG